MVTKTRRKPKAKKKHQVKRTVKARNPRTAKRQTGSRKPAATIAPTSLSTIKVCEEVEVGDIGGFGSPEELESHENRCSEPASHRCYTCGRNLCGTHYEILHRDHDLSHREPASLRV